MHLVLNGPKNSPYEGERIPITIELKENHPLNSPNILIEKMIFHPWFFMPGGCLCWYDLVNIHNI